MALDIDSGYTIIRSDNVSYSDFVTYDPYLVDIEQTILAAARNTQTWTAASTTASTLFAKYYVPYMSSTVTYFDKFLYKDANWGTLGY
jgi:hypothetical protein